MKTKKNLVKSMFMSILTVGFFAMVFAACNDEMEGMYPNGNQAPEGAETALLEAYGLTFENFISDDDVIILDADTTQLSVSRAYAEKMGISSFVNHPMGIWHSMNELPYTRKAIAEKLEGDRYILTVKPATVAEIIGDKKVTLNTELYVNPDAGNRSLTRSDGRKMPGYAAKYQDENEVIHPAVVYMTDPYGYDKGYHTDDDQPVLTTRAGNSVQYMTADELLSQRTRASVRNRILSFNDKLEKDFKLACGEESGDTVNLGFNAALNFELNYFITLDGGVKWNYVIPEPYVEKFEAGVDGKFGFSSELTLGFKKEWELDKDKYKKTLFEFSSYTFTFWVGPVPVVIKTDPHLNLQLDGKITGEAKVGVKYEYANTFMGGICYTDDNGWSVIKEFNEEKNDLTFISPQVALHAEAGIGLYLGADITIYGVAGPELCVGPRLGASADLTVSPFDEKKLDLKADVKLTVNAVVGAKLKLLGYELASYSKTIELAGPWTLWKYPSDGTEHKVGEDEEMQNQWDEMEKGWIAQNPAYAAKEKHVTSTLMKIRSIDYPVAHALLRSYLMNKFAEQFGSKVINNVNCAISWLTDYILVDLQKEYDEWEYQQHANDGDTEWINAKNWERISDILYNSYDCKKYYDLFDSVHEWFVKTFNREPSESTEDLTWLADHIVNYDTRLAEQHTKDWNACVTNIKSKFASYATQYPDLFQKALNDTKDTFRTKYDCFPTPNDSRVYTLFQTIMEDYISKSEQPTYNTDWTVVSSILKSELEPYFTQYNKYSSRALTQTHNWYRSMYGHEPSTSAEDIEMLKTFFIEYMKNTYNIQL